MASTSAVRLSATPIGPRLWLPRRSLHLLGWLIRLQLAAHEWPLAHARPCRLLPRLPPTIYGLQMHLLLVLLGRAHIVAGLSL